MHSASRILQMRPAKVLSSSEPAIPSEKWASSDDLATDRTGRSGVLERPVQLGKAPRRGHLGARPAVAGRPPPREHRAHRHPPDLAPDRRQQDAGRARARHRHLDALREAEEVQPPRRPPRLPRPRRALTPATVPRARARSPATRRLPRLRLRSAPSRASSGACWATARATSIPRACCASPASTCTCRGSTCAPPRNASPAACTTAPPRPGRPPPRPRRPPDGIWTPGLLLAMANRAWGTRWCPAGSRTAAVGPRPAAGLAYPGGQGGPACVAPGRFFTGQGCSHGVAALPAAARVAWGSPTRARQTTAITQTKVRDSTNR
jgi:hypothetical protein